MSERSSCCFVCPAASSCATSAAGMKKRPRSGGSLASAAGAGAGAGSGCSPPRARLPGRRFREMGPEGVATSTVSLRGSGDGGTGMEAERVSGVRVAPRLGAGSKHQRRGEQRRLRTPPPDAAAAAPNQRRRAHTSRTLTPRRRCRCCTTQARAAPPLAPPAVGRWSTARSCCCSTPSTRRRRSAPPSERSAAAKRANKRSAFTCAAGARRNKESVVYGLVQLVASCLWRPPGLRAVLWRRAA